MTTPTKSLLREFLGLAVPTVLSGIIYTLYTITDGIFIGRYLGEQSLAALNLIVPLLYVPYAVSLMVGVGGSTLAARMLGQERPAQAREVFTQALIVIAVVSVAMSGGVLLFLPEIARGMGATGALADEVQAYLGAVAWFSLFANLLYALELFLRTEGEHAARVGLYAMGLGAVVNVALDYWFIVVLKMGMAGPGFATGISLMTSSLAMLAYHQFVARKVRPCRHPFRHESHIWSIVYNGASELLGAMAPAIVVFAFNRVLLRAYGEPGLAAYAVIEYLTLAATVVMVGLVQSMQPMVSFYSGANQPRLVKRSLFLGATAVLLTSAFAAMTILWVAQPVAMLFLPTGTAAWAILGAAVPWYAMSFPVAGCNLIIAGYFTAVERPGPSALIAVLRSWVLMFGTLGTLIWWLGDAAVWRTLIVSESATLLVSAGLLCYYWRDLHTAHPASRAAT